MNESSARNRVTSEESSGSVWMAAVAAIVLLAHGPQLLSLGARMWATEHYSFFPLILIGSLVIAWQRYGDFLARNSGDLWDSSFRSPLLWLTSILLLSVGVVAHSPWLAGISFLLALRASINSLCSARFARYVMPAWWFLWLAIPLPLNLDRHLILSMQLLATRLASGVLDLMGIRHALSGVVIDLPGKSFFVEEACSGIQSLFAAISVTIFYSIMGYRGFLRTLLLVLCGIGWVVAANALRIIAVTVLSTRFQIPIDTGWAHEATGAAVFVLALLLIVSTDRLLLFLAPLTSRSGFESHTSQSSRSRSQTRRLPLSPRWTISAGVAVAVLFGVLGLVQITHAITNDKRNLILDRGEEITSEQTLPEEWNGWTKQGFQIIHRKPSDPNGQISRVWQYERNGQSVLFSLDGPFTVWHDLGLCYTSQGWTVTTEQDHTRMTDTGPRYDYSELSQENLDGQHAYVAFTAFDPQGDPVAPPPFFRVGVGMRFPDAATAIKQVADMLTGSATSSPTGGGIVYQAQAYVEAGSLLTEAEQRVIRELFHHLTSQIRLEFQQQISIDTVTEEDPT